MATNSKPRKLYETGGSIVCSLPRDVRETIDVSAGSYVMVSAEGDRIVIQPAQLAGQQGIEVEDQ